MLTFLLASETRNMPLRYSGASAIRFSHMDRCGKVGGSGGSNKPGGKALTIGNLNPNMIKLEYAVRGPLVVRAVQLIQELKKGANKPFKKVILANVGDAQAMGQKSITYLRQVLACVVFPQLLECNFPSDVKEKAKEVLANCAGGSVGSYTGSFGIELFRKHIAKFIECRDGHPANWEDITLTSGASAGIKFCLQMFCNTVNGKPSGIMVPIPQYPLYSATITEFGLVKVDYYLDEDNTWALSIPELQRALDEAKSKCVVRGIAVINPGNPTGQVLTRKNIEDVIKFAHANGLFVFADEVYQENVYAAGSKFFAFKKVLREMGDPYSKDLELVSFMTVSKGRTGECGARGGWMEIVNLDKEVQANLYKCMSAQLCPNVLGQTVVDCIADPPKQGSESYEKWTSERKAIFDSLAVRAKMIAETFNKMPGFKCNEVQGAMYAFPRLDMPQKAIEAAKKENKKPDVFYAFKLLEETGICVIAGSGFGQKPGTYHFRTTILPQPDMLKEMLQIFQKFHEKFAKEFS